MLGAVMFGHREMQKVIDGIIRLAEKAAKEPRDVKVDTYEDEAKALADIAEAALKEAYQIAEKAARHQRIETIRAPRPSRSWAMKKASFRKTSSQNCSRNWKAG